MKAVNSQKQRLHWMIGIMKWCVPKMFRTRLYFGGGCLTRSTSQAKKAKEAEKAAVCKLAATDLLRTVAHHVPMFTHVSKLGWVPLTGGQGLRQPQPRFCRLRKPRKLKRPRNGQSQIAEGQVLGSMQIHASICKSIVDSFRERSCIHKPWVEG